MRNEFVVVPEKVLSYEIIIFLLAYQRRAKECIFMMNGTGLNPLTESLS